MFDNGAFIPPSIPSASLSFASRFAADKFVNPFNKHKLIKQILQKGIYRSMAE